MKKALLKGDATRTPRRIDEWLAGKVSGDAVCPMCRNVLGKRATLTPGRSAHFAHEPGTACPTVNAAHKPYAIFAKVERTTPEEARRVKEYALAHVESIYERARAICPDLTWLEFLPLLVKATELNVWAFKDLDPLYLPYILLACEDEFPARSKKRPSPICFTLEPEAGTAQFWHQPAGMKQYIWCVDRKNLTVDEILMSLHEVEPWYRTRARRALGL